MYFQHVLHAANGYGYGERINEELQREFGLVAARSVDQIGPRPESARNILVFEDSSGKGRWRTHFRYGSSVIGSGQIDEIRFSYFTRPEEMDVDSLEVFETDHMNVAFLHSQSIIAPEYLLEVPAGMDINLRIPAFFSSMFGHGHWERLSRDVKLAVLDRYGPQLSDDCRKDLERLRTE